MRTIFYHLLIIVCIGSCKVNPDSNKNYDDKSKVYKLHLNPSTASRYYYDISNQTEISVELNNNKSKSLNKTTAGFFYDISKDSSGNFLVKVQYDKLHLYSKKDDIESDVDADNAAATLNPLEKMLGTLRGAKISATINSKGDVTNIRGYKEIGDKIFSELNFTDDNTRNMAKDQWEKMIGDGIVKNNMDEMFKVFPDSAVHIGDSWKINNVQNGLNLKNIYKLKTISDDIAIIESEGVINSDSLSTGLAGLNFLPGELKGDQQGQYEMESKSGMLISVKIKATVSGEISVGGSQVPITIAILVKINGRKVM